MGIRQKLFFKFSYYFNPPWDTGISPPELETFIQSHPTGRALELGCGTGTNAITLVKAGWQVMAVDFSSRAIRLAQKNAAGQNLNVDWKIADVSRLSNLKQDFNLVLDIGCLHSLSEMDRRRYIRNLPILLAPDGTYLLFAFLDLEGNSAPAIHQSDIQDLMTGLTLQERQDGFSRSRPSAWFTFKKQA